jgi:hypothetical protein
MRRVPREQTLGWHSRAMSQVTMMSKISTSAPIGTAMWTSSMREALKQDKDQQHKKMSTVHHPMIMTNSRRSSKSINRSCPKEFAATL